MPADILGGGGGSSSANDVPYLGGGPTDGQPLIVIATGSMEQGSAAQISTYAAFPVAHNAPQTVRGLISLEENYAWGGGAGYTEAEGQHAGVMACWQDNDNNYIAMISVAAQQFQLVKQVAGVETKLAMRPLAGSPLAYGVRYRVEIRGNGVNVTASLKNEAGTTVIDTVTVADTSFAAGGFPGYHGFSCRYRGHGLAVAT